MHNFGVIVTGLVIVIASSIQLHADANETGTENANMASTLALVSLQVFRNGSIKLADLEALKKTHQGPVSNISLEDIRKDNQTIQNQIRSRERLKQERLLTIQAQILQRLGLVGRMPSSTTNVTASSLNDEVGRKIIDVVENGPPPTAKTFLDDQIMPSNKDSSDKIVAPGIGVTDINEFSTSEIYAQRLQSFYPSCDAPNSTDTAQWKTPNEYQMKLYFDLTIPRSTDSRTHITIMWAKLRLYLYAGPQCVKSRLNSNTGSSTYLDMMMLCETNTITISLYQYMRPWRHNRRERRRMLDSRTVPISYRGSIEFNMQSVINYWQNMPDRNYGLVVQVEDTFGNLLPSTLYLQPMNCSDPGIPIPNLADLYGEHVLNKTDVIGKNRLRYPTLDLMTMESARDEHVTLRNGLTASSIFTSPLSTTLFRHQIASNELPNDRF